MVPTGRQCVREDVSYLLPMNAVGTAGSRHASEGWGPPTQFSFRQEICRFRFFLYPPSALQGRPFGGAMMKRNGLKAIK